MRMRSFSRLVNRHSAAMFAFKYGLVFAAGAAASSWAIYTGKVDRVQAKIEQAQTLAHDVYAPVARFLDPANTTSSQEANTLSHIEPPSGDQPSKPKF